jgi:hypothetical protein
MKMQSRRERSFNLLGVELMSSDGDELARENRNAKGKKSWLTWESNPD